MSYRVLVGENLDPQTALFLRNRGHDALHVSEVLGSGTEDNAIAKYAREQEYVILTNDRDFVALERTNELRVVLVADNDMPAHEIANTVDELAELVPESTDLDRVTWV